MTLQDKTLGFIGSGAMGGAMISGLLERELIAPDAIIAADPNQERGRQLVEQYGLHHTTSNVETAEKADIVILGVKPQVMDSVLGDIAGRVKPEALVITIAAGVKSKRIAEGCRTRNIVRAMPNTPGQIGAGMVVWTAAPQVTEAQRDMAEVVLGAMGETLYVQDEHYLDMATAINGSGPAYVFLFMEAMIDAGVHMGFSRQVAQQLAEQTMLGAVQYALQSDQSLTDLRHQVTSPGGTTAAALHELEKGNLRTVVSNAIWAAYRRSQALGGEE